MSALPPKADIDWRYDIVRFVVKGLNRSRGRALRAAGTATR